MENQKILYCVLNWGLGHASRSIPIIQKLLDLHNEVSLASDGDSLLLLKKTFPNLPAFTLPAYGINYKHSSMILNMLKQSGKIWLAILEEEDWIDEYAEHRKPDAIISDNRYGCHHSSCKNIFVTHQIQILHQNAFLSWSATRLNKWLMKPFQECWVPDHAGKPNLTGFMSHDHTLEIPVKYMGPVSRFTKISKSEQLTYRTLSILSGPEPQRTLLQDKLLAIFREIEGQHAMITGKNIQMVKNDNVTLFGLLDHQKISELAKISDLVISRSGYSSIMDYEAMGIRALLIPTPGQPEQLFLGRWMKKNNRHWVVEQDNLDTRYVLGLL